jgi:hypothetical protein
VPVVPSCAPNTGNVVVGLRVTPPSGWGSVRTYFRRDGTKEFYFLEMRSSDAGYWAVLPKSSCGKSRIEIYFAVTDEAGRIEATRIQNIPVENDCKVPTLSRPELRFAQSLVIGETAASQHNQRVVGFCCDGIISSLDVNGGLALHDECRRAMMAQVPCCCGCVAPFPWVPLAVLGGAGAGAAIITHDVTPPLSEPRP